MQGKENFLTFLILIFLFLFVAALIVGIIIIQFFVSKVRNRKEEIKNKKINAIFTYGFYYNNINNLNKKYHFLPFRDRIKINTKAQSKRSLDGLLLNRIITYYIENNIDGFRDNFEAIMTNRKLYNNYLRAYKNIMAFPWSPDDIIAYTIFETKDEFIMLEKEMIQTITVNDSFNLIVDINAYYNSPRGRNHWVKRDSYCYEDVLYCYRQWKESPKYEVNAAYERSLMSESLRYDIFKRDHFRCRICGASAEEGAKLHVDHIVPVSKGGKTVPSNLQTLCQRCNLGKSNKM